jgi:hypothetical protein
MRDRVVLFIHFIATLARWLRSGGARSIVAESLLLKHQLLILNRSRQRAPNLSASDRILAGWLALWLRPTRLLRSVLVLYQKRPQRRKLVASSESAAVAFDTTLGLLGTYRGSRDDSFGLHSQASFNTGSAMPFSVKAGRGGQRSFRRRPDHAP